MLHFSSSRLVTSLRLLAVEPDLVTLRSHHPYSAGSKTPWVQCFFFQFLLVVGVKWCRFYYNWRFNSQTSNLFAHPHSKGHTTQTWTKLLDLPWLFERVLLIAKKIFLHPSKFQHFLLKKLKIEAIRIINHTTMKKTNNRNISPCNTDISRTDSLSSADRESFTVC